MGRLFFASLLTLGLLSSFVFGIVILVLLYSSTIDIYFAIGLTVGINFSLWLVGPYLSDLINKWVYKVNFVSKEELTQQHPEVSQIIEQVSTQYKFRFPKIGIIPDKNPTAFTYGSARFNSRIILTEGIFHFLNPQEVRAVVAHELGHIVNRDFIVMMVASTLVQILYEIYAVLIRVKGKKSGLPKLIALASYVFYIIGIYLLYYLSRTREYLADEFSTKFTEPNDLSNALIKIAYGIVTVEDDDRSKRLLQSTRHLGIIDVKNAKHYGVTSYVTHNDPNVLAEVMVFDKVNPWAKLAELNSTHPLTGNRIDHLSDISKAQGRPFSFDIDGAIERMQINTSKLYSSFSLGIFIFFLPYIFALIAFFYLPIALLPAAFALGLLLQLPYKFPFGAPVETTVLEQMRNPYASPLRGKPIVLSGQVIGKGIPGYILGEDMMYQDSTGLVFLNYSSAFGFIGNIFFALKKIKTLFGISSRAAGWFYRGIGSMVSLKYIKSDQGKVRSHPILWSFLFPVILIGISFLIFLLGFTRLNTTSLFSVTQDARVMSTLGWQAYADQTSGIAFKYPQVWHILSDNNTAPVVSGTKDIVMQSASYLWKKDPQAPNGIGLTVKSSDLTNSIIYVLKFTVSTNGSKTLSQDSGFYECPNLMDRCVFNDSLVRYIHDRDGYHPGEFLEKEAQSFFELLTVKELSSFLKENNMWILPAGTENWIIGNKEANWFNAKLRDANVTYWYPPEWNLEYKHPKYPPGGGGPPNITLSLSSPINKDIVPGKESVYLLEITISQSGEKIIKSQGFFDKLSLTGDVPLIVDQEMIKTTNEYQQAQKIFDSFVINYIKILGIMKYKKDPLVHKTRGSFLVTIIHRLY